MSVLCRNTKMCAKLRFKSLFTVILQQFRRDSHSSWDNRCLVRRQQGIRLDGPCSNFFTKRHFQISSTLHSEDIMASQIAAATTADNIFVTLNSIDDLTPPHIVAAFGALDKLMDAQLMAQPWTIYSDPTMRCVQSLMNSEAREMYDPILQCPEFDRLCYEAQKCRTTLSNSDLVNVTLNMTRMHVDTHSDVFRNLLYECQHRLEECDLVTLVHFSSISNLLKRSGFILSAQIAHVLQERWDDLEISEQNLLSIIKLWHSVGYFITKETLLSNQKKILKMLRKHHSAVPTDMLMDLMEALSRFSGNTRHEIKEIVMLRVKKQLDDISCWFLPRIVFQLMVNSNSSDNELIGMLSRRATSMITKHNQDLRPADVVALVRMSRLVEFSPSSMKVLGFLLENRMKDFDVMLLKYASISNPMIFIRPNNAGLVQAFCEQVQHKVKDLLKSLSCLLSVTHCLAKIPSRPPEFDRVYTHHVMNHILDQQLGAQPKHIATIGRYLVQCFQRSDLRSVGLFTSKLIQSLPRLTLIDIANISLGINSFENITVRSSYEQIITNFSREILLRSNEIENITVLNILVKSVFLKLSGSFRDAIIGDLEELYVTHSPSLTLRSVKNTCQLLKQLRMSNKTLSDHLIAIIINSRTDTSLSDIAQVLDHLIRVNYCHADLDTIQEVANSKISAVNSLCGPDLMDVLLIANSLASFQMFPEDVIKRVFSVNFLMELDTWIESNTSNSRSQQVYMLNMLSDLNRSVMLQCPQLSQSIAWFCDCYTKPSYSNLDTNAIARWKSSVYAGLKDALGGDEYVKMGPLLTPYNHSYDFECVLDENCRPLPFLETDQEHIRCRVAVLLMTPTKYCKNSRTLSGHMENKVAQMEILGFRVVVIPYSHLDSMMLNDPDSRRKYFYDAIVDGMS